MATDNPGDRSQQYASREAAEGWNRHQAARGDSLGLAAERLVELVQLRLGHRVLDVAAGTGEQTLVAARRVGPAGFVLAVDTSAAMMEVAVQAAQGAGLDNIETRVMDAQALQLPDASFDAAICRNGLQLMSDRNKMLQGIWRALKSGGRLGVMVFAALEQNAYFAVPNRVLRRRAGRPSGEPEASGQFALGDPDRLATLFRAAGFREVAVESVAAPRRFSSLAEAVDSLPQLTRPNLLPDLIAALSEAERDLAWAEIQAEFQAFEGADGVDLPGEVLVAVGAK